MKLLYHGAFFAGSTALHRMDGFAAQPGIEVSPSEIPSPPASRNIIARLRSRARWPLDLSSENSCLIDAAVRARPDAVFIDNSKVITRRTLRTLRGVGVRALIYYSPDDVVAPHNLTWPLRRSFPEWDLFFSTKTCNLPELSRRGVRRPRRAGNAFSPRDHRPWTASEIGAEFERFDLVFIGTYERHRADSILKLAQAGMSVVVYGNDAGAFAGWNALNHPNVTRRPAVYAEDYSRCLHHGKIALCFLRKANRDQITTRSIEIAAAARPMLAEKTAEHDAHFLDGRDYLGFTNDGSLIAQACRLLDDPTLRASLGQAARDRCLGSGYSAEHRSVEMLDEIARVLDGTAARHTG